MCFHNCGESVLWRSKKPLVETETLLIKIVFDYTTLISWHLKETITIRYLNPIFHEFSKRNSNPFPAKKAKDDYSSDLTKCCVLQQET